jgi:hypothetical protein
MVLWLGMNNIFIILKFGYTGVPVRFSVHHVKTQQMVGIHTQDRDVCNIKCLSRTFLHISLDFLILSILCGLCTASWPCVALAYC